MMISYIIILLYISFTFEFLLWPVPSEASTGQLLHAWRTNQLKQNVLFLIIFIFNLFFTLTPAILSLYSLIYKNLFQIYFFTYLGVILAWIGRVISTFGAYTLYKNKQQHLISNSIFKWSRNPISLGLFITFFGLVLLFPHYLLIIGLVVFVMSIDYKIGFEEKFLYEKFGTPYQNYRRSTPKYFLV
jgi:protein-S-isoprenylcysteine O-methyltransferase Ste14